MLQYIEVPLEEGKKRYLTGKELPEDGAGLIIKSFLIQKILVMLRR